MIEVRAFTATDDPGLRDLFARAGEGSPTEALWGDPASEAAIYLDPYIEREPESLFVAERAGALVGYLTGCLDSSTFPSESERFDRAIREHHLFRRTAALRFFTRSTADLVRAKVRRQPVAGSFVDSRWPSHLHINVAPEARGTGAADLLMTRWLVRVRESGSPGCHLQTLVENTRAVRFFRRAGFVDYGPTTRVPGIRYQGRRVRQQNMVWSP